MKEGKERKERRLESSPSHGPTDKALVLGSFTEKVVGYCVS
jgi:hypothetical protein